MREAIRQRLRSWERAVRRVYVIDLLWRSLRDFQRQEGTTSAAAISYYVLFSFFPLLIFLVAVFGFLIRDPQIQADVVEAIVDQFPEEANLRRQVESVVAGVAEPDSSLIGFIGVLGMGWTASGMFRALRRALNRAFGDAPTRTFFRGAVVDMLSVLGAMAMALLSVVTTTVLTAIRAWTSESFGTGSLDVVWQVVTRLIPLALSFVTFAIVYGLIPQRRPKSPELWIGALLAAVGFEIAKAGFGVYVRYFGNFQEVYGAIGGVVAALVFVYVAAVLVIFVAEVTSELSNDREARAARRRATRREVPT